MKVKKDVWDSFMYVILCVTTLGGAYFLRIILSQAVRMALQEKPAEAVSAS